MKLLLTGVTGYIGRNVANYFVNKGYVVHALVRKMPCESLTLSKNISFHVISENSLCDIICQIKPDIVIHIASKFLAAHKYDDINELIESNLTFPTQLLEAMVVSGTKNFINTGTSWEHYESESYNPVNLYAATKKAFESLIKYYTDAHKVKCLTVKIFDSYGPNDTRGKLVSLLDKLASTQQELSMSPGEQKLSLVHIDDITSAYEVALKQVMDMQPGDSHAYGLISAEIVTIKQLVSIYEKVNNCQLNITWGGREYREREVMAPASNLNCLPGWRPIIPLNIGLKK